MNDCFIWRRGDSGPFSREVDQSIAAHIHESAQRKLDMLNAAESLDDLRSPPGNRLEALRGTLHGSYSIRVNAQWRIVFRWEASNAHDVKIIDYH